MIAVLLVAPVAEARNIKESNHQRILCVCVCVCVVLGGEERDKSEEEKEG